MEKVLTLIVAAMAIISCGSARYAQGPDSREIESLSGLDGKVVTAEYSTAEKGLSKRRLVAYLPPSYSTDTLRRYPVLYLLHGARGNEITWNERGEVFKGLDSLRRSGKAEEFILILPNVNNYFGDKDYRGGHAVNATRAFWTVDGEVEGRFTSEVVATADSLWRTDPHKESRAIAGMSSGALQAIYISANHPDAFAYVGLFSPYFYPNVAALGHMDFYGGLQRKLERQFGENPPLAYDMMIGDRDFFYPHVRAMSRRFERNGWPHRFHVIHDGHEWTAWHDFFMLFASGLFHPAAGR